MIRPDHVPADDDTDETPEVLPVSCELLEELAEALDECGEDRFDSLNRSIFPEVRRVLEAAEAVVEVIRGR